MAWTGERCVPWVDDLQVLYEHLHRYLFASRLAAGKRILDLGSGEGYGAALLATSAAEVLGVEIDAASVEHALRNYRLDNVEFRHGSILELGDLPDGSFDLVVCFEVIEHITEHDALLALVGRVLGPEGLFVDLDSGSRDLLGGRELPQPVPRQGVESARARRPAGRFLRPPSAVESVRGGRLEASAGRGVAGEPSVDQIEVTEGRRPLGGIRACARPLPLGCRLKGAAPTAARSLVARPSRGPARSRHPPRHSPRRNRQPSTTAPSSCTSCGSRSASVGRSRSMRLRSSSRGRTPSARSGGSPSRGRQRTRVQEDARHSGGSSTLPGSR